MHVLSQTRTHTNTASAALVGFLQTLATLAEQQLKKHGTLSAICLQQQRSVVAIVASWPATICSLCVSRWVVACESSVGEVRSVTFIAWQYDFWFSAHFCLLVEWMWRHIKRTIMMANLFVAFSVFFVLSISWRTFFEYEAI